MLSPNTPSNEKDRLRALKELGLLDTGAEKEFDEIVSLASFICKTPIATITLIDENRQWFKSQTGLEVSETPRDVAFCAHAILQNELMVVEDASKDQRFFDNPLVTGSPDIRFYAGMPLTTNEGFNLGTICVIDTKPRDLTKEQRQALDLLRNQVLRLFELRRKGILLSRMNALNQRLLGVIGHDVRAPINSIDGILELWEKYNVSLEEIKPLLPRLRAQVEGAKVLLNNLLLWAKNHIEGKYIPAERLNVRQAVTEITDTMRDVIDAKKNHLELSIDKDIMFVVNHNIFHFIIRNLVANANKFTNNGKITMEVKIGEDKLRLSVSDDGVGIPSDRIDHIFEWGKSKSTKGTAGETGSGLGLPMVKEFVEYVGGTITARSIPGNGATFIVEYPESP